MLLYFKWIILKRWKAPGFRSNELPPGVPGKEGRALESQVSAHTPSAQEPGKKTAEGSSLTGGSCASHGGPSSTPLHARTRCQDRLSWRKHLQMPLYPSGKKWANPAEQTPAHGFAFVFISQNEAVPVADSGWIYLKYVSKAQSWSGFQTTTGSMGIQINISFCSFSLKMISPW